MAIDFMVETQHKLVDNKDYDIACFVLLTDNKKFNINKPSYSIDLLGKQTFEWVTRACPTRPTTIECDENDSPLDVIKPYLRQREWTLVLYGDTPLITRANIDRILAFVENKGLNVCKLARGFVFRTEYIKRVDEIFAPQTYSFNDEEFEVADSLVELDRIRKVLQARILEFHQLHGVLLTDADSVYVESDVAIGAGVTIENNVSLVGKTEIGAGACVGAGSKIKNSRIGEMTKMGAVKIFDSVIKDNCEIGDNVVLKSGSFVGDCALIGDSCVVAASSIAAGVSVGAMTMLKFARVYGEAKVGEKCLILGEQDKVSRVLRGAIIGGGAVIGEGVAVKENCVVPVGTVLNKTEN